MHTEGRVEAPELRIVPHDLWQRVKETLDARAAISVLDAAVEKALAQLAKRQRAVLERRAQVERELTQVQQRLDRLVDALADGSLPADEIRARLSTEKARKAVLSANLDKLGRVAGFASMQPRAWRSLLRARR